MKSDTLFRNMFFCSIAFHCCLFGAPFGRLKIPPTPCAAEIVIQTEVDHPALLPPVVRIKEERIIKRVEEVPPPLPVHEELPSAAKTVQEHPVPAGAEEKQPGPVEDKKTIAAIPDVKCVSDTPSEKPANKIDPGARIGDTERESAFCYRDAVKQRIEAMRRYPKIAHRRGIEGTAVVVFTILPDGTAHDILVVRSSGSGILDDEVVMTVRRASPFPAPPGGHAVNIQVPVIFSLK